MTCIKYPHYLNHHLEYKRPATIFLSFLIALLPRFTLAPLYQAGLTMGGGGKAGQARVYFK